MASSNHDKIRKSLATLGLPARLAGIEDGAAGITVVLEIDPRLGPEAETLRQKAEAALAQFGTVSVIMTAERAAAEPPPARGKLPEKRSLAGVGAIVAVASGKGGVGKSTAAVNLALAMAAEGTRAGLLDADIYGPSLPRMLGLSGQPEITPEKRILPLSAHGMPVMSMGFLVPEDKAMIWRGAMVQGAVQQMLHQVAWNHAGNLDVLLVDMPPGTGDAHLTLAQQVPLAGAVIVSTPQDIALIDAVKALAMYRRLDVPVLGVIENMSYYCCPECGHRAEIFGHGGAREAAQRLETAFLGEIPLDIRIRTTGDTGIPIVAAEPDGIHAAAFRAIARQVLHAVASDSVSAV